MPGWIPRWHPFVWIIVIVLVVGIWQDPAGWGGRVHSIVSYIPVLGDRLTTFITHI
jgi:hypothetical protein